MSINDYCSADEVTESMPDGNWGTSYNALIAKLITRASRLIDIEVGKKPGAFYVSADVTRYFDGSGTSVLKIGELAAAPTSVGLSFNGGVQAQDYTALVATDYLLFPWNAADEGLPYTEIHLDKLNSTYAVWYAYPRSAKIVGKFGFATSVPDLIKEAAIMQVARWLKRGQQGFADTGAIAELGQLTYTKKLDPEVANILKDFHGSPL